MGEIRGNLEGKDDAKIDWSKDNNKILRIVPLLCKYFVETDLKCQGDRKIFNFLLHCLSSFGEWINCIVQTSEMCDEYEKNDFRTDFDVF